MTARRSSTESVMCYGAEPLTVFCSPPQLTVNAVALVSAVVGVLYGGVAPLNVLQVRLTDA